MTIKKDPQNDADVRMLMAAYPDLIADGRVISHAQIETVLRMPRIASRYRTVTHKWRRAVFDERRVYLDGRTAEGAGFVCLTADEMVRFANREVRSVGRKLKKALAVASAPHDGDLSDDVRLYRRRLEAAALKIAADHRAGLRELGRALAPMKQLPRASGQ